MLTEQNKKRDEVDGYAVVWGLQFAQQRWLGEETELNHGSSTQTGEGPAQLRFTDNVGPQDRSVEELACVGISRGTEVTGTAGRKGFEARDGGELGTK